MEGIGGSGFEFSLEINRILNLLARLAGFLIRALRPLVWIRIGRLRSRRIGYLAANVELYCCERDDPAGAVPPRTIDFFYHETPVCNHQLKKMWDPVIRVWDFAGRIAASQQNRPGWDRHTIRLRSDRDVKGYLARTPPHLSFTPAEEDFGRRELERIGIPSGTPFVCFLARDAAYLRDSLPNTDWNYHRYRDCNVENYAQAMLDLAGRGYYCLRMGASVESPLKTSHPRIIDYARVFRTDFLDVYLPARCSFFVSDTAGLYAVAMIFRRRLAYVNIIPFAYVPSWSSGDVFIPKKLRRRRDGQLLKFREILASNLGESFRREAYDAAGVDPVENTPEEIAAVVREVEERMKGTWKSRPGDDELQDRFWSLLRNSELHGRIEARIGSDFLRENAALLD